MPRPPNYSQERMQRDRKQRAKAEEKAERIAQKTALRKAAKGEGTPPDPKPEEPR